VQCRANGRVRCAWPGVHAAGAVCTLNAALECFPRPLRCLPVHCGGAVCTAATVHTTKVPMRGSSVRDGLVWSGTFALGECVARASDPARLLRVWWQLLSSYSVGLANALKGRGRPAMCARNAGTSSTSCPCRTAYRAGSRRADAYCLPNCARHLDKVRRAPKQMAPFA
jgi:hypothetical protein